MDFFGSLSQTYESATRSHILRTYPVAGDTPENVHGRARYATPAVKLATGDVLTVFNSVAAGDVLWKGNLNFLGKDAITGANPMGMSPLQWKAMFNADLPVKLNKHNGEVIDGLLFRWNEQGSDDCYNVFDFKNKGYHSLHSLEDNDYLEIFSTVTKGDVVWQGELKMSSSPLPTGRLGMKFDDEGICRGERGPEYVGNAFFTPSIKIVREWQHRLPMRLTQK